MIQIELQNKQKAFRPGDSIEGRVNWEGFENEVEKLEIRLIWFTSGKGTRDFEIADSLVESAVGERGSMGFSFEAPSRPYSFSVSLISLTWAIEVIFFPDHEAENLELVISSTAEEITLNCG